MSVPFWLRDAPWDVQQGYSRTHRPSVMGDAQSIASQRDAINAATQYAMQQNARQHGGWTRRSEGGSGPPPGSMAYRNAYGSPSPARAGGWQPPPSLPERRLTLADFNMPGPAPEHEIPSFPGVSVSPLPAMPDYGPLQSLVFPNVDLQPATGVGDFASILGNVMAAMGQGQPPPSLSSPVFSVGMPASDISTSITPQMPITPQMSNEAVNQQVARAHQAASLPHLLAMAGRGGMANTSPAIAASVVPQMAQALSQANAAPVTQSFADQMVNLKSLLGGQQAREQEALALAGLGQNQNQILQHAQLAQALPLLQLLSQYAAG